MQSSIHTRNRALPRADHSAKYNKVKIPSQILDRHASLIFPPSPCSSEIDREPEDRHSHHREEDYQGDGRHEDDERFDQKEVAEG